MVMLSCFQNAYFYKSRTVLNKARELAAIKDITALGELSHSEVCSISVCPMSRTSPGINFSLHFDLLL